MNQTLIFNQIIGFGAGVLVGYVLHIIVTVLRDTKEEVDEILDLEHKRDERGILQHRVAFNITYLTMMVFVFYAAFASFHNSRELIQNQKEDFVRVCVAGEQIRDVQRSTVDEVYNLAIGIVNPNPKPPRTPEEILRTNLFIDRANEFRAKSYEDIHPTVSCKDVVNDNDVKPPTEPFPHVTH